MKTLKAYLFGELSPEARIPAEAGAYFYAAAMLMQNNNCPGHMVPKMHQTFLDEHLGGYFDATGSVRFPPSIMKEPKEPVSSTSDEKEKQDAVVEEFPKS